MLVNCLLNYVNNWMLTTDVDIPANVRTTTVIKADVPEGTTTVDE